MLLVINTIQKPNTINIFLFLFYHNLSKHKVTALDTMTAKCPLPSLQSIYSIVKLQTDI